MTSLRAERERSMTYNHTYDERGRAIEYDPRLAAQEAVVVLRRAADLIGAPGVWTQGAEARDARGEPVDPCDPAARFWCGWGGLQRAAGNRSGPAFAVSVRALLGALNDRPLSLYNDDDGRTALDVAQLMRATASRLEMVP